VLWRCIFTSQKTTKIRLNETRPLRHPTLYNGGDSAVGRGSKPYQGQRFSYSTLAHYLGVGSRSKPSPDTPTTDPETVLTARSETTTRRVTTPRTHQKRTEEEKVVTNTPVTEKLQVREHVPGRHFAAFTLLLHPAGPIDHPSKWPLSWLSHVIRGRPVGVLLDPRRLGAGSLTRKRTTWPWKRSWRSRIRQVTLLYPSRTIEHLLVRHVGLKLAGQRYPTMRRRDVATKEAVGQCPCFTLKQDWRKRKKRWERRNRRPNQRWADLNHNLRNK